MKKYNLLSRCICLIIVTALLFLALYLGHILCSFVSRFDLADLFVQFKENWMWVLLGVIITLISDTLLQKFQKIKAKRNN